MRHQASSKAVVTLQQIDENDEPIGQPFQVEVNADDGTFDFFDVLTQCQQQTGVLGLILVDVVEA